MSYFAGAEILNSFQLEQEGSKIITRDYTDKRPSWVNGQISRADSIFLSGLIQALRPPRCVEIGVASGWSSSILLSSLHHVRGEEFHLHGLDLSEHYYLDSTILTGSVVDVMVPDLRKHYTLTTGVYAFEGMKTVGAVDFGFIDAHHMHPWAALDLIALLPFIKQGGWIAMHDINLCRFPRHQHKNRGPFYTYYMWPDAKLNSTQQIPMIGAICIKDKPTDYMPIILEILSTPWEMAISNDILKRMTEFVNIYFDPGTASEFAKVCDADVARFSP